MRSCHFYSENCNSTCSHALMVEDKWCFVCDAHLIVMTAAAIIKRPMFGTPSANPSKIVTIKVDDLILFENEDII